MTRIRVSMGGLALALCLVALIGAATVSTRVFERLPHTEDELAFLFQARTLAQGRLWAPAPPGGGFFDAPFIIVRDGKWFGKYTPGYPLLLAIGVLAGQPWLLNPLLAALCVGLIYLLGRKVYGAGTGLLAAALAAASPFLLLQAGSLLSHVACLFWTLLFTLIFLCARETGQRGAALAAGFVMGMLLLSRPLTAIGVGLPFALWAAADMVAPWAGYEKGRRQATYALMLAGFAPAVLALLAYNQTTTGSPLVFAYQLYWPYDRIGFGEGIGANGSHTLEAALLNTRLSVAALQHYLFGWPGRWSLVPAMLALLAALAHVWQMQKGRQEVGGDKEGLCLDAVTGEKATARANSRTSSVSLDVLLACLPLTLALVYMAYWSTGLMYGPRYYFEALGALVLLSARGLLFASSLVRTVLGLAAREHVARASALGTLLVLGVVVTLFADAYRGWVPQTMGAYVGWYGINARGLEAVRAAGVHDAVVFVKAPLWTDYAALFAQNLPTLDGDIVYAKDLGVDADSQMLLRYPGRTVYLWDGEKLEPFW